MVVEALSGGKYKVVKSEALITVTEGKNEATFTASSDAGKDEYVAKHPGIRSLFARLDVRRSDIHGCDNHARPSLNMTDVDDESDPPVRTKGGSKDGLSIHCHVESWVWSNGRTGAVFVQIDKP